MTDLLIQSPSNNSPGVESYRYGLREGCRSPILARYTTNFEERTHGYGLSELKHSKSDDLFLQSAPATAAEMHHGISDAALEIQKEACVVYEEDLTVPQSVCPKSLPVYYSDSETNNGAKCKQIEKPVLKITGDFGSDVPSRRSSRHITLYDRLDPEDSIRDIISENDFYRFVLFKRHYEKYLDISKKYEEARNIAYYLEEKYHEIKAERDHLTRRHNELQRRLESRDGELHDKEEELFLQLEKAIRLEEDCEKLRTEKEKMVEWKERLERDKNESYRQLKLQAEESESTRRRLERARNDVVRQVTAIMAEKESLERENVRLKEALEDIERNSHRSGRSHNSVHSLEKEVFDLKLVAKQSATLNSQLRKGMKHLATCRRRKCSVCAYTRTTFGEYAADNSGKRLFSCFVDTRKRSRSAQGRHNSTWSDIDIVTDRMSEVSLAVPPSPSPSTHYCPSPLPLKHISYIDDVSSSSEGECEERGYASTTPHAFSSDSGFSSELCESSTPAKSLQRATRWTSSFRRLIRRVSKRQLNNTN